MISIETIFNVLNFLTYLFLIVFFFKTYLVSYFVAEKKKFDSDMKDKQQARTSLQVTLDQLALEQKNQVIYAELLEKKCDLWVRQMQKKSETSRVENEQIKKEMIERKQRQWIYIQHQRCLQQKLPIIFQNVEQYFDVLSNKEKASKEYCDSLITFMKEQS